MCRRRSCRCLICYLYCTYSCHLLLLCCLLFLLLCHSPRAGIAASPQEFCLGWSCISWLIILQVKTPPAVPVSSQACQMGVLAVVIHSMVVYCSTLQSGSFWCWQQEPPLVGPKFWCRLASTICWPAGALQDIVPHRQVCHLWCGLEGCTQ